MSSEGSLETGKEEGKYFFPIISLSDNESREMFRKLTKRNIDYNRDAAASSTNQYSSPLIGLIICEGKFNGLYSPLNT